MAEPKTPVNGANDSVGPNEPKQFNIYTKTQPTKPGEPKPCDTDDSQNKDHPEWANYIENICFNWMKSKCKGRHSEFCPGYIYHKDPSYINVPYGSTSYPKMGELLG